MEQECKPREYLQNVGMKILEERSLGESTPEDLFQRIYDNAYTYYLKLWDICSQDEKHTLYYLANDGFLSAKNAHIEQLMKSGFIVQDNSLHLMNESFRRFVLKVSPSKDIIVWQETVSSSWNTIRIPFMAVLFSLVIFLSFTQKEFVQSTIAIITVITDGLPAIFKLLDLFQKTKL